jgi:hypothetical protein
MQQSEVSFRGMEGNQIKQYIMWNYNPQFMTHDKLMLATLLARATEEETSVHILCDCEALTSLGYKYLGSFLLDPENIRKLSKGAICNLGPGVA